MGALSAARGLGFALCAPGEQPIDLSYVRAHALTKSRIDYRPGTAFYDAVGNIAQIQHRPQRGASTQAWTRKYLYAGGSNRLLATSLPADPEGTFSERYSYDDHGSMIDQRHPRQGGRLGLVVLHRSCE